MCRIVFILAFTAFLAACTGQLPSHDGKLPSLDGSALSNVTASRMGQETDTQIDTVYTAVSTATTNATGSTLVQRDAAGNFSAGTITGNLNGTASIAQFAIGQQGAPIASTTTPKLGGDGDFFTLTGSNSIAGFAAKTPGARVTVSFAGAVTLEHNTGSSPKLQLVGKGNFLTTAGDLFEFIFDGADWRESRRTVTNESQVAAHVAAVGASYPSVTLRPLIFDIKDLDSQNEYSTSTGDFVAHQDGTYLVVAGFLLDTAIWPATGGGYYCALRFTVTPPGGVAAAVFSTEANIPAAFVGYCGVTASQTLRLTAQSTLSVSIVQNSGMALTVGNFPTYNVFSVMRIHD